VTHFRKSVHFFINVWPKWCLYEAMSYFAIDLGEETSYSLMAPRGGNAQIIENLAVSNQPSAFSQNIEKPCDPLPTWDWVWDWVTQGSRKGLPRATQAPRKGDPRVDLRKWLCLQQRWKNAGWGGKRLRTSPELPKLVIEKTGPHRRHRKGKKLTTQARRHGEQPKIGKANL
jgi:hypothetical protein